MQKTFFRMLTLYCTILYFDLFYSLQKLIKLNLVNYQLFLLLITFSDLFSATSMKMD